MVQRMRNTVTNAWSILGEKNALDIVRQSTAKYLVKFLSHGIEQRGNSPVFLGSSRIVKSRNVMARTLQNVSQDTLKHQRQDVQGADVIGLKKPNEAS